MAIFIVATSKYFIDKRAQNISCSNQLLCRQGCFLLMKLILSRKGFDAAYGGQPSPILPDGTLLSLPIPYPDDINTYANLFHGGESYYEILKDLKPNTPVRPMDTCHLDPDLRLAAKDRPAGWKPIFGQVDAAQTHLQNQNISVGDLFLFFGWFRQTEFINGRYRYKSGSPDWHLIFGYLQIGEIYSCGEVFPDYAMHHPHSKERFQQVKTNCIYVASDALSFDERLPGAGTLKFKDNLILTRPGMSRSRWHLPSFFRNLPISYHTAHSFKEDYFQSAAQGQEFVIRVNEEVLQWVKNLICYNDQA